MRNWNSLAGDDVFCGYIRGAVCGQRYLSRTDFSDCQLPVIKTKNALMPDKAENVALRGRPLGGDTFWPELQKTSETDTRKPHAGCRPNSMIWEVHPVLPITPTPPHPTPSALFFFLQWRVGSSLKLKRLNPLSAQYSFFFFSQRKTKHFLKIVALFLPGELSGVQL